MPDLGPILANLVSMDLESFWGFDQWERFKAFRFHLRPSHRLILFFSPSPLLPSFFSYALTSFIQSSLEEKSLLVASFFHSCKWKLRFLYFLSSVSFSFFFFFSLILPNSFLISSFAKVYSRFKIYSQNRITSDRIRGTRRKREI